MKRLVLLRHAKAAPKDSEDFDRALAPAGRSEMAPIARRLGADDLQPDIALVSPARRTRETWDLAKGSGSDVAVSFDERIYEAPAERLLAVLRDADGIVADGSAERVILVGHNPGISELASALAGSGEGLDRLLRGMPTASLAVIDFDVEAWRDIAPGQGRLAAFVTPDSAH